MDYLALYFGYEIKLNAAEPEDLEKELGLTDAYVKAITAAREKAPSADVAALTANPVLKDAKHEPLKTRIKFTDKKPAGVK